MIVLVTFERLITQNPCPNLPELHGSSSFLVAEQELQETPSEDWLQAQD